MLLRRKSKLRKNTLLRHKATFLLSLIFVSILTTLPILQYTNVEAAIQSADMTQSDKIKSLIYFKAVSNCLAHTTTGQMVNTSEKVEAGTWFEATAKTDVGIYMNDTLNLGVGTFNGNSFEYAWATCNSIIRPALIFWGFNNLREVLCNSGFRSDGPTQRIEDCIGDDLKPSSVGWYQESQTPGALFEEYITQQVYNGVNPNSHFPLNDAEVYRFFMHSLAQSCIPGIEDPTNISPNRLSDDDRHYNDVPYVDITKTPPVVESVSFRGSLAKTDKIAIGPLMYGVNTGAFQMTCQDMVTALGENKRADHYRDWVEANPGLALKERERLGDNKTSCAIEGVGWIICPVVNFLAGIADGAFGFLANNFLQTKPEIFNNNSDNPTFKAWGTMRNFANIAFVIAFLIIIFSQLTSIGITNYGIKKLLPRLIIAAVLVNISYYICQIAVDLSNILGWSLKDLLEGIATQSQIPTASHWASNGGQFGNIALDVLAIGGGAVGLGIMAWTSLATLIPILLAALVALVMILFILVARQALIILLIVISPLAFVAFLLPNTEDWFKKWQKAFTAMLMLFPIIALVFGMSSLASYILQGAFASTGIHMFAQIIAAAVMALPLFVVPGLLKKALDGVGTIGGKLTALGNKWGGAAGDKYKNSAFNKYQEGQKADERARIATGNYAGRNPLSKWRSKANRRLNKSGLGNRLTGGYGAHLELGAQAQNRKDMQDTMAMFNNDDSLVSAWADTGGNVEKMKTWTDPTGRSLSGSQQEQFKLMVNAGYQRKSNSHIAAAQYLSENGKGNAASIRSALSNATEAGASDIDTSVAFEGAKAAYRKSGRGDVLAELDGKTPVEAWSQVAPSSVHREAITSPTGAAGYSAFLQDSAENTRSALVGYDQMEQRARVKAEGLIVAAAQVHAGKLPVPPGGTPIVINNIQEAKAHFGVR